MRPCRRLPATPLLAALLPLAVGLCAPAPLQAAPAPAGSRSSTVPASADVPPGPPTYYQAEIRSLGLAAEVRLNDLPIYDDDGVRGGGSVGGAINDSVIDGRNTLRVTLRPVPGRPLFAHDSITLISIRISRLRAGSKPVPLYVYQWKMEDAHTPLPHPQASFESQTHFGVRSWQRAAPVTLDAATAAGVRSLVTRLHKAMQDKDAPGMTALLRVRARDGAITSGMTTAQFLAGQEDHFRQKFARPGWGMRPLDPAGLRFRLYGEGRVVGVTDAHGREALQSLPDRDGVVTGITVYASLLDGQWAITR